MSLMVAEKLNKITDKNLISLLKQLLKQINDFIKSLLNTKELNINDIEADNIKFLIENKLKELIKNGTIKKEC
jgi:arsenate reductase-like glutaredoxin family protein